MRRGVPGGVDGEEERTYVAIVSEKEGMERLEEKVEQRRLEIDVAISFLQGLAPATIRLWRHTAPRLNSCLS